MSDWLLTNLPLVGEPLGVVGLVAVLAFAAVALVLRLVRFVLRIAVPALLVGLLLLATLGGSVHVLPLPSRSAIGWKVLDLARRGSVAAYHATVAGLISVRAADSVPLMKTDETVVRLQPTPTAPVISAHTLGWVAVAHTGGEGVYLRATPRMVDRLRAWADGTSLEVAGEGTIGDGHHWKWVRAPDGQLGWVPEDFVVPTAPP